jgi:hypothetical protein
MRLLTTLALALLLLPVLPGCDNSDPVGPRNRVVTVTASPAQIEVGQTSAIVVTVFKPDGSPAAGEPLMLTTSLGTLEETSFVLDAMGRAETVLTAGDDAGTAVVTGTVTAGGQPNTGSVNVEITAPAQPPGELDVQPSALDLTHSRPTSPCPNLFEPPLVLSNVGVAELDYAVSDGLPEWLAVDAPTGEVPGTLQVRYTCLGVGEGDQDLAHQLTIQGIDRATQEPVGDPVEVTVTLHVRSL